MDSQLEDPSIGIISNLPVRFFFPSWSSMLKVKFPRRSLSLALNSAALTLTVFQNRQNTQLQCTTLFTRLHRVLCAYNQKLHLQTGPVPDLFGGKILAAKFISAKFCMRNFFFVKFQSYKKGLVNLYNEGQYFGDRFWSSLKIYYYKNERTKQIISQLKRRSTFFNKKTDPLPLLPVLGTVQTVSFLGAQLCGCFGGYILA